MELYVLSIFLSVLYTVILYGAGPLLLFKLRKKRIVRKKLVVFSVCYTFCAWFISNMIWALTTESKFSSGYAGVLWGTIFYYCMKAGFNRKLMLIEKELPPAIPEEKKEDHWYTCPKCGQLVREGEDCDCEAMKGQLTKTEVSPQAEVLTEPPQQETPEKNLDTKEKKPVKSRRIAYIAAAFSFLIIITIAAAGWITAYQKDTRISELEAKTSELEKEISNIKAEADTIRDARDLTIKENENLQSEIEKLERDVDELFQYLPDAIFLYNKIGFIVDETNLYHNYECPIFQSKMADGYLAHNIKFCEYLGLTKCSKCW